ncbi:MAG: hypothetical protein IH881_00875 [Myxococcales bacterium]|nr:hypothetical protein [Myxococcales bacterium]
MLRSARPAETGNAPDWRIAVFGIAISGAAFLIFLVQPMVAKRILPWFGGTPAVWMLCLTFYQSALFVGYVYAHALVRWVPPGIQAGIHGCLLLAAIMALPILPADSWASVAVEEPTLRIMTLLASEIALPFVVLAATGPLVQAWFARRHPTRSPYPLYALSNLGSMLALFAFPFIVEPRWPLSLAGRGWGVGLVCVALAIIACGVMALRAGPRGRAPDRSAGVQGGAGRDPVGLWLVLSAAAVVLLMGVSNQLCLDIASIPFLWILPLSIYLLTFILCFSDRRWIRPGPFLVLALLALAAIAVKALSYYWIVTMGWDVEAATVERVRMLGSVYIEVCIYSLLLLSTCMLLHGELYRRRPPPERLTSFYLYVSGGGALGGLFVGLLAPRIFPDYYELEAGLILALVGLA